MKSSSKILWAIVIVLVVASGCYVIASFSSVNVDSYDSATNKKAASSTAVSTSSSITIATSTVPDFMVTHVATPAIVKGIYMSSWVAGSPSIRSKLVSLLDTTELNAVVIDVKDSTGRISFTVDDPTLTAVGSVEKRISDIKEFVATLHAKGIYVIGRVAVFEDPYFVKTHPEYAVKTKDGAVWKDRNGISWLDAGATPVWDYVAAIGKQAYAYGFDEINFDYIRFPSDGNMQDIAYPYSEGKDKPTVLNNFFTYMDSVFRPLNIPTSIDIFGETTTSNGDLGIGQVLENALAHFNYVSPMVYPSHFADGFNGWKIPAAEPYGIVDYSMTRAQERAVKLATATSTIVVSKIVIGTGTTTRTVSTSTVVAITPPAHVGQLRPWLQDFSLGKTSYTPLMVREQIQATYDARQSIGDAPDRGGVLGTELDGSGWLLWNAANKYDAAALLGPDDTLSNSTQFATTSAALNTYAAP